MNRLEDEDPRDISRAASGSTASPSSAAGIALHLAALPGSSVRFAERATRDEVDHLRAEFERLLAWRALRCVGAVPLLGAAARRSLDVERSASRAVAAALAAILRRDRRRCVAVEVADLAAWIGDFSDSATSYDHLRAAGLLKPRPPRLPRAGDWRGRDTVLAWADSVLTDR